MSNMNVVTQVYVLVFIKARPNLIDLLFLGYYCTLIIKINIAKNLGNRNLFLTN